MGIREASNKGDPRELGSITGKKTTMDIKKTKRMKLITTNFFTTAHLLREESYTEKKNSINTSDLSRRRRLNRLRTRLLPLNSKRVIVGNGSYRGVIKWRRVRYQTVPRLTERITITKLDDVNRSCDCRSQLFPMPITTSLFNTSDL